MTTATAHQTDLTRWLKHQRATHALTQQQTADLIRVSLSSYRKWEQGERIPSYQSRRLLELEYAELDRQQDAS